VRRLSYCFCFQRNLSLVTSAATGSGVFQRAANTAPEPKAAPLLPPSLRSYGRTGRSTVAAVRPRAACLPKPRRRPLRSTVPTDAIQLLIERGARPSGSHPSASRRRNPTAGHLPLLPWRRGPGRGGRLSRVPPFISRLRFGTPMPQIRASRPPRRLTPPAVAATAALPSAFCLSQFPPPPHLAACETANTAQPTANTSLPHG
jgi:hypothetical protein